MVNELLCMMDAHRRSPHVDIASRQRWAGYNSGRLTAVHSNYCSAITTAWNIREIG
jgi:hypothetical protein